jgi:hypothetical protein
MHKQCKSGFQLYVRDAVLYGPSGHYLPFGLQCWYKLRPAAPQTQQPLWPHVAVQPWLQTTTRDSWQMEPDASSPTNVSCMYWLSQQASADLRKHIDIPTSTPNGKSPVGAAEPKPSGVAEACNNRRQPCQVQPAAGPSFYSGLTVEPGLKPRSRPAPAPCRRAGGNADEAAALLFRCRSGCMCAFRSRIGLRIRSPWSWQRG